MRCTCSIAMEPVEQQFLQIAYTAEEFDLESIAPPDWPLYMEKLGGRLPTR